MPTLIDYKYADALTCFCGWGTSREAMLAVLMMRPRRCASMCRPSACTEGVLGQGYCFTHMSKKY